MNFEQMCDAERVRLGVPASDTFYTAERLGDLTNEALQAISTEFDWPWLEASTTFSTAIGTATYTPPADWMRTRGLCIDGSDAMEYRSLIELREVPTTTTGEPGFYHINTELITLRPIPSSVQTVIHDYVKIEPALANPTDTPLMPAQFHYAIVAYAVHLGHMRQGDVQRATAALGDYTSWLRRMTDNRRRQTGGVRVRVRPGGGFA